MKLYYTNKKLYQDKLENHYYFIKPLYQAYKVKVQDNILKNKCNNNMYNVYIEI